MRRLSIESIRYRIRKKDQNIIQQIQRNRDDKVHPQ